MVEKLSAADESRIMRALEKAAAMTRTGASPDEALVKSAKELGLNPEMTKVACQAFNKSKSVYMLSKLAADRRGENFDLSDPAKVVGGVFEPKTAAAPNTSLDNIMKDFSGLGLMPKAACAISLLQKQASVSEPVSDTQRDFEYKRSMRETLRALDTFDKLRRDMEMRKTAAELSVQDACDRLARTRRPELEKLARVIVNRYGADGERFMRVAQAKIGVELDLRKTAAAAAIPAREPYFSVVRSMEAMESYNAAKNHLEGVAREALRPMPKAAADGVSPLLQAPLGAAWGAAVSPFAIASGVLPEQASKWQELAAGGGKPEEAISEALDPIMIKKLENMDLEDAWVEMSKDKFIASHPRGKVLSAISDVVNVMPSLKVAHNKPLLTAMVRKQLAQGGAIDPVEVGQLATTEKSLRQSEKEGANLKPEAVAQGEASAQIVRGAKEPSIADVPEQKFEFAQKVPEAAESFLSALLSDKEKSK